MSDHNMADVVASGMPYSITAVNGRTPASLDDFGTDSVEVVVTHNDQRITIHGTGHRVDDHTVVIYEKADGGVGKDVRTWDITGGAGGFEATERSIF